MFSRDSGPAFERPMLGERRPAVPLGMRAYAIGDVHGRLDLLQRLEAKIARDAREVGQDRDLFVVYLGDYVDRGFESRQVLDHLVRGSLDGFTRVTLLGNHDWWLREFVRGRDPGGSWVHFGGDTTLVSYGAKLNPSLPEDQRLEQAYRQMRERVPPVHLDFLDECDLAFGMGDYFFCHAGIRPGVSLDRQNDHDLMWIREPFLSWRGEGEKIVVHGHTVGEAPVVRRNRIGIDTGACFTGNLTCLVLDGEEIGFLSTADTGE